MPITAAYWTALSVRVVSYAELSGRIPAVESAAPGRACPACAVSGPPCADAADAASTTITTLAHHVVRRVTRPVRCLVTPLVILRAIPRVIRPVIRLNVTPIVRHPCAAAPIG